MSNRIKVGHLGRFWDNDFKSLSFTKQDVTQEEIDTWSELGYSPQHVKSYTGSMYDSSNVMPEWISILENVFGLYQQTYTFYRMETCEIMPVHSDHFRTYCRLNNTTPDQVWRVVVMLEDWKPGHYFEMDGVGYVNWKEGDWFMWQGDVPHAAANIGSEPRYTLQITGLAVSAGQLNRLYSFNVPGIDPQPSHPFVNMDLLPKVNEKRFMLYMNNGPIDELLPVKHTEEERQVLNEDGLHVYLYEPICSYADVRHTQGFYSEFGDVNPEDLRAEELNSISHYAWTNGLTNVTVHTGDYDVAKWYPHYSNIKLVCDDIFLQTQRKISGIREEPSKQFHRDFICLNWRFTNHRQLLSTFLAGKNGYLSWYFKADFDTMKKGLFFDLDSWETKHPELYQQLKEGCNIVRSFGPFVIDKAAPESTIITDTNNVEMWPPIEGLQPGYTPSLSNQLSNGLSVFYAESFIDIVNETRFAQPTANISEKVFQPMQYLRPFVLAAPPKSLEYLRSLGFKTFGEFWDESYDDELDHGERLAKIFKLLNTIFAMTNQEQRALYEQMIPVLTHNLNRYKEIVI